MIAQRDETIKDDELEAMQQSLREKGYDEKFINSIRADPYYITKKQTPEIEKENALIRLNAMKNVKPTKSTEELKKMNPIKSTTNQYNKKTTGEIIPPITLTTDEEKQLEEIAKEMEKTEMWTGE